MKKRYSKWLEEKVYDMVVISAYLYIHNIGVI